MTTPTEHRGAQVFHGDVSFGGRVYLPAEAVDDDHISSDTAKRISSTKLVHRQDVHAAQSGGGDVASETRMLRVCRGAAEALSFELRIATAPTGGDKQYTVDLQQAADGSGSWATLLDAVITVSSSDADNALKTATLIATPTAAAGAALRIVVTASGSTGSQGQGFVATAAIAEEPS